MPRVKVSRKEFLLASGATLAGTVIAACTPAAPATAKPAPTAAGEEVPVAPGKEVTISFMGWGGTEEDEGVRAAIDVFQEENPNIKVTWLHTPDNYGEKMLSMVAAGTPPDTAFVGSDSFATYARDGMLLDISEQLNADPVMGKKGYFIEPQETERCTYQGRWYGIGSCWVAPHIYYNADVFEAAGIEPPSNDPAEAWDWDHFLEVARELTVDASGKHPGEGGFDINNVERWAIDWPTWWIPLHAAVQSNGGRWLNRETGLVELDKPEAIEAIQRIADLMLVHQVMPQSTVFEELGMSNTQMLESGKLAMGVDGSWALAWMRKIEAKLGTAVMPKMTRPATDMQAHLHCGFAGSKEPEAAWQWVRFLATEFYQLHFLRMGLWLPSQTDLMTPEGMDKWMTLRTSPSEGIHPEGYDKIVTEFVPKYGHVLYMVPGYPKVTSIIDPAFDAIWVGDMTAEEALTAAVPEANAILAAEPK